MSGIFTGAKRLVVKVGSSLVTNEGRGLDHAAVARWAEEIAQLKRDGRDVVLVSSGAIAEGIKRLGWSARPRAIHELQAAAAVGQMGLVQAYESAFAKFGLHTAQILLTHEDLADRRRYLNARTTLRTLLALAVIPIINENDTVTTDEIRVGDNDTLARTGGQPDRGRRPHPAHRPAGALHGGSAQESAGDVRPRGARRRSRARSDGGRRRQHAWPWRHADQGARGEARGALRRVDGDRMRPRSQRADAARGRRSRSAPRWSRLPCRSARASSGSPITCNSRARLRLDAGAVRALTHEGKSLLPIGVVAVEGHFERGEVVGCYAPDGREVARGLVNYGAQDAAKILRKPSAEIESILGYVDEAELIHRDNLVLLA